MYNIYIYVHIVHICLDPMSTKTALRWSCSGRADARVDEALISPVERIDGNAESTSINQNPTWEPWGWELISSFCFVHAFYPGHWTTCRGQRAGFNIQVEQKPVIRTEVCLDTHDTNSQLQVFPPQTPLTKASQTQHLGQNRECWLAITCWCKMEACKTCPWIA